jgi:hypothetical protein
MNASSEGERWVLLGERDHLFQKHGLSDDAHGEVAQFLNRLWDDKNLFAINEDIP